MNDEIESKIKTLAKGPRKKENENNKKTNRKENEDNHKTNIKNKLIQNDRIIRSRSPNKSNVKK